MRSSAISTGAGSAPARRTIDKIARFFDVEIAGDRCPAAADPLLNHRGGIDAVVEHDGEAALDVGRGDLFEEPRRRRC